MDSTTSFYYLTTLTRYLAESYALAENYEKAYATMLLHQSYRDSLNSETQQEQFLRIQEEFNAEKRENEIHQLSSDKDQLAYKLHSSTLIFALSSGIILLLLLLIFFYYRQRRARDFQKRIELEQKALRVQMNPHFIFNSLNSLQSMFMKGNFDLANDYLGDFGALLRHILENSGKSAISLEEELNTLDLYLSNERMRTDGMIDYEIVVDPEIDASAHFVPPLIIQPFVENAIWHGILPSQRKGRVTIHVHPVNADTLKCVICDDGIGISASRLRKKNDGHKSKGMEITRQRLRKSNDLQIEDLPTGGTRVVLFIPMNHDQSANY
jgi:sensor histidine kinase YesM